MGEQTKIRPESIVIMGNPSFIAGTYNEYTKASVDKTSSSPKQESYPFIITAKTSDGKEFVAAGNTSENQSKTAQITNYKVGDKERRLPEPLEIKIEDGKLAPLSLKNFEQLINKGSTTTGMFGYRKTIKSEEIPNVAPTLPNDKNLKAALEQVNQPSADFQSTSNAALPAKSQKSGISLA